MSMTVSEPTTRSVARSSWARSVAQAISSLFTIKAEFEHGTYTPTLTGMAIGTGGGADNSATYTYVGGPEVGDKGVLTVDGFIIFGTSGTTFPTSPQIALPSGFEIISPSSNLPAGLCYVIDSGTSANNRILMIQQTTAVPTAVRPLNGGFAAQLSGVSTSTPFTWAAGDSIYWHINVQVTRV